ncbi:MAG: AtpZ/AtpI family protein [Beijerinckiaceae bacterium]|nr:AtpZ/AtpI family protein [Beijerinckiaceae bacterium]MCZ8298880.1 AtpZ/AtpI family protein [Beijerinckiaceae bacterium]
MADPEPDVPKPGPKASSPGGEMESLRSRLDALKAQREGESARGGLFGGSSSKGTDNGAFAKAMRATSELAAGVIVGGGIGYLLDRQLGTLPIFLIIFLMVGMAAGFLNLYKLGMRRTDGTDGPRT